MRRRHTYYFLIIGAAAILAGLYLLGNLASPIVYKSNPIAQAKAATAQLDQVLIPSIGAQATIFEGGADQLANGAWHRYPERGNPRIGGNMILSAHSFVFRWNPLETRQDSYFYNLHKLQVGENVYIDWEGARYKYQVTKIYQVKPNAIEIEEPSKQARLTLYTCTPGGSADGRVVVEAQPTF